VIRTASDAGGYREGCIVALVGPSASGKSGVALELALLLGAEVVSVDSMQVYRGMDIGTAKPTAAEQARVPHHLLDLTEVGTGFDVAAFRAAALPVIDDILARGKRPLLCGGTGFYFAALLGGLGCAPASSPELRAQLESAPLDQLLEELRRCDPAGFEVVDRRNRRRVMRAVEVFRLTGRPFSEQRRSPPAAPSHPVEDQRRWRIFGLLRTAEDLRARIEARVKTMFDQGLVEETRRLLALGLEHNRVALQAIGYRQCVEHLRGERSLAATRELIQTRTRQFARRQMTWFRRRLRVTWLTVGKEEAANETATRISKLL
jgi:tRNA dimethylallyltransferase